MILNTFDQQLSLDYITYMMVGSYFRKAEAVSKRREQIARTRYQLLNHKTQYALEDDCEQFFLRNIFPKLPAQFFAREAKVRFALSRDGLRTAVVFSCGKQQLWISSLYGGSYKHPVFEFWTIGFKQKPDGPGREGHKPRIHVSVMKKAG